MKVQTTQKERMPARATAGGLGMAVAVAINSLLIRYLEIELPPEAIAAIAGLLTTVAGMVMSRLGK